MTDPVPNGRPETRPRARRRGLVLGGVLIALAGLAGVLYGPGWNGKAGSTACPGGGTSAAKLVPLARGEVAAFAVGQPPRLAPDLAFIDPDGRPTSLAAFRGRTALVNFWATWCVPCRTEMPALDRLRARLGGPGFEVVAINVDTARLDKPKAFLRDNGITNLAFYADPSANVLQALRSEGALVGLPTTLLIDRTGCELGVMAGQADWASPDAQRLIEAATN